MSRGGATRGPPLPEGVDVAYPLPGEKIECAEEAGLIGIEFTTFSLIGRCERTGMFGIAIATSENG